MDFTQCVCVSVYRCFDGRSGFMFWVTWRNWNTLQHLNHPPSDTASLPITLESSSLLCYAFMTHFALSVPFCAAFRACSCTGTVSAWNRKLQHLRYVADPAGATRNISGTFKWRLNAENLCPLSRTENGMLHVQPFMSRLVPSLLLACSKQYKVRTVFCILSHLVRARFIVSDWSGRNQKAINHFRLVPRLRMSGVLPQFPLYALRRAQPLLFYKALLKNCGKSKYSFRHVCPSVRT